MIRIQKLEFAYPHSSFRLQIEDLKLDTAERVAFVGPSGSGKTTLLHLLAGIYLPAAGSIQIGDVCINQLPDAARRAFRISRFGFVFQNFELMEYLNVRENILLPYFINGTLRLDESIRRRADALAETVGMGDKLNRVAARLSQGEQQRVAICRSLITRPQVILADEPTGNLDAANKHRVLELLIEQASEQQAVLLVVTHDESLLSSFDRVVAFDSFRHQAAAADSAGGVLE